MENSEKNRIRKTVLEARDALDPQVRADLSDKIWAQLCLLEAFGDSRVILFYASFRSEVETYEMIRASFRMGKKVVLPKIDRKEKKFTLYSITDCENLVAGAYGILEPPDDSANEVRVSQLEMVLAPGSVFDHRGYRIGYGEGYYDKFLNHPEVQAKKVGLAFDMQIASTVPHEEHDVPMDWVVTESGVMVYDHGA